jgi:hypothetical protein
MPEQSAQQQSFIYNMERCMHMDVSYNCIVNFYAHKYMMQENNACAERGVRLSIVSLWSRRWSGRRFLKFNQVDALAFVFTRPFHVRVVAVA